ncbi:MAG: aminotransferase class I/II-fold pyridoxal phosphate-dependent enzyme, partial [Bacteroidota bacterium]
VVVDEAYIDFSNQKSLATEVKQHPNLVVLQTLSKAFGLAGIRLGLAIAQPDIIQLMMKVKAPYNVNALTSQAALNAFNHLDTVDTNKTVLLKERDRVINQLKTFPELEFIYPSDANFILFRVKNAKTIYQELARHHVIVRYRGNEPLCEDTLRLTIGTEAENDQFFNALSIALGS